MEANLRAGGLCENNRIKSLLLLPVLVCNNVVHFLFVQTIDIGDVRYPFARRSVHFDVNIQKRDFEV